MTTTQQRLNEAISELTRDHPVRHLEHFVMEMSLLDQLKDAFTASKGGAGSSGMKAHKALYSLTASDLYREIAEETDARWRGRGRPALARTPLAQKIQDVAKHYQDKEELLVLVEDWNARIRACFESYTDLIGGCPECGECEYLSTDDIDGSVTRNTALRRRVGDFWAECKLCQASWSGIDDMKYLSDHMKPLPKVHAF